MKGVTLRIAVIDDEAPMRRALGRLLGSYGHLVTEFESGIAFLETFQARYFDCLILDLHMPVMNGFEVLGSLAQEFCPPRVIVLSGQDQACNQERLAVLGASAYLLKPIDERPLMEAIERCTGGLAGLEERPH